MTLAIPSIETVALALGVAAAPLAAYADGHGSMDIVDTAVEAGTSTPGPLR